jgi:NitT/TauT family transport system ATP-binding protein
MGDVILELQGVAKHFRSADGHERSVLDSVDFRLRDGEIVALLGASGSGKSTLLRILAGLISADAGNVLYRGQPLYGPARGIGMVFQSFALFPWLTVQQNVELGLEARGVAPELRADRAESAIALIGLGGFEGALPRELSGGMRQRVGIARALVTDPDVLLMDEAFSALDVLTGERLRDDILALWQTPQMPTRAMLVVSHNIEEAVLMADRVLVFASDPGRVQQELPVTLARPRDPDSAEVRSLVDQVYALMTHRPLRAARPAGVAGVAGQVAPALLAERLPEADVSRMDGLLDLLAEPPFNGRADLPLLAEETELTDAELLPVAHAVALLGLAQLEAGDLQLTPLGQRYVDGYHGLRQQLFGQQLLAHVPLAAHIRQGLEQSPSGELPDKPLRRLLADQLGDREAARVLHTVIDWGRHGEVFEYNVTTHQLRLPTDEEGDASPLDGDAPG